MVLKQKITDGLFWSFLDSFAGQGIQFLVGIILARILSPKEFGLIGILTVFISISQIFVDSGFGNALIRKINCTQKDFSTVLVYNLVVSISVYLLLFFFSNQVALFFSESRLNYLLKVLGLVVIVNGLSIVHRTILFKNLDFKIQARISIISSVASGIIAISMAFLGFGVLSLVILILSRSVLNTFLLWVCIKWKFSIIFDWNSFKELFGFGGKLLLSGLFDTLYRNLYYIIIGKYFSFLELGQYTRAEQFNALPSQNLASIVNNVSYPVLASLQNDKIILKKVYKRIIKNTMFLAFISMFLLSAIAIPLIYTLIGQKWIISAEYLQILCFIGVLYPLNSLNLNMLQVLGRSDLFLKLEVIKKFLAIPSIIIGVYFGIKIMLFCMITNSIIAYYLNSYWSGKFIDYSIRDQIRDISPSFLFALCISSITFLISKILIYDSLIVLIIQLSVALSLFFGLGEALEFREYLEIKQIVLDKIKEFKKIRKLV